MAFCAAAAWGWSVRDERYLNAEFGLGYGLGIAGLAAMCLMLLYSVRKRALLGWRLGALRRWLSVHMFLGLFGPLCILFHANFRLGSLNSTVSLACMSLVAGSGVLGRFLYPRIHTGLMGQKATLGELRRGLEARRQQLGDVASRGSHIECALKESEALALGAGSVPRLLLRGPALGRRRAALRGAGIDDYLAALRGVLRFRIYERCFALWHAFHLPLCFLMFGAAAIHVVAVHLY